jgi:hypothetical protein
MLSTFILHVNMNPFCFVFLLLLPYLCQSNVMVSSRTVEARASAFFPPRGGGMNRKSRVSPTKENPADAVDSTAPAESEDCVASNDIAEESAHTFDRRAVSRQFHAEKVDEIKKSQQFLQKQQRRRELDKTWLDKAITAVVEFFENLFRWEVIDV